MTNQTSFTTPVVTDDLTQAAYAVKEAEGQIELAKENLESKKAHLETIRAQLRETQLPLLIAQLKALGASVSDLGLTKSGKGSASPVPPKYRDPVTGKTWSGRGNAPKWISGKDFAQFLITATPIESRAVDMQSATYGQPALV
jgi:DNA-binding protein H-NS